MNQLNQERCLAEEKFSEQTLEHVPVKPQAISTDPLHSPETLWKKINWKRAEKHVRGLQERIYRATKKKQWKKVRSLEILLARSYDNKLLAIREVTQRRAGRNTPGVDSELINTNEKRWKLSLEDFDFRYSKPKPVKRIYIPKVDGNKRPLGIPTIRDRIMQMIIKIALEPEWEARFEPHSYGFRPGRCTMDVMAEIRKKLAYSNKSVWILDGDISKCFDNIAHEPLLKDIPVFRRIIHRWLKAGVLEFGIHVNTDAGTPQGGVISPLLANIALTGMENLFMNQKPKGISLLRFADDFVVIAHSKAILERYVLPKIGLFLSERGMSLNQAKTKIVHREEGFDFLGFTIRYFKNKIKPTLLITPTKTNILRLVKKLKLIFSHSLFTPMREVIKKANSIIRGWLNYYIYSNASKSFSYVNYRIFRIIWSRLR
ncbi:hypothetical protein LCGC14_2338350, partial [marine sediment metagenome]